MNRHKRSLSCNILNFGAALIAAAVVVCISVTMTVLARPLYYFDIEYLHIPERTGCSADICKANYDVLIDYNLIGGESELIFPDFPMSEHGKIHFEEVKEIFIAMQIVSIIGVIALLFWFIWIRKKRLGREYFLWLRLTGIVIIAAAGIAGVSVAVDWERTFTVMHEIFFDNDYWLFDIYTDPVINILPDTFFMHCGIFILILTVFQVIILELAYRRLNSERNKL